MPKPHPAAELDMSEFLATPSAGPCIVARSLAILEQEDRVRFEAAMSMPQSQAPTLRIVKAFWAREIRINKESVQKHRDRQCCCGR